MDMEQEMQRLQGVEREFMEYLKAQCELVGADTNVEGLENPRLALACRYALTQKPYVGELLKSATAFFELSKKHRDTAYACDHAGLPAEFGDYERGKADAYEVVHATLKKLAKLATP